MRRLAAPIIFWALVAVVGMVFAVFQSKPTKTPDKILQPFVVEEALPASTVTDADGKQIALSEIIKPNTLVVFWSVYCGECHTTLKDIQDFALKNPSVSVVAIAQRNTVKDALAKLADYQVSVPSYYDLTGDAFTAWRSTMPGVFFTDANKIIVLRFPGRPSKEHYESIQKVYFAGAGQ